MHPHLAHDLRRLAPINLAALNAKAAMLERLDNKYVVRTPNFAPALGSLATRFDVLEIDGRRSFTYATRYFDDDDRRAYFDHHQGRRKRCKVRLRRYLDAGFSHLEVKLKDSRDVTVKKRLKVADGLQQLDETCINFIETSYRDHYGESFGRRLRPTVDMQYERITLVAREGGERMTIDTGLVFHSATRLLDVESDLLILETKSARGNGIADAILRGLHLHPTPRCSKYCVAMAALGEVGRVNRFLPALKRLNLWSPQGFDGLARAV